MYSTNDHLVEASWLWGGSFKIQTDKFEWPCFLFCISVIKTYSTTHFVVFYVYFQLVCFSKQFPFFLNAKLSNACISLFSSIKPGSSGHDSLPLFNYSCWEALRSSLSLRFLGRYSRSKQPLLCTDGVFY